MSGRIRGLKFAAVIAVAAVGACAGDDDKDKGWDTKTEGMAPSGWVWVGEGEQQNFATADRFCSRATVASDARLGAQTKSQMSGSNAEKGVSEGDRRAYWSCMQGRGWKAQGS